RLDAIRPLIHPEDWLPLIRGWKNLLRDAQTFQTEFRVLRPGGDMRWCVGSAAANTGPDGRITRVSRVIIDITDRKEAEEPQTLALALHELATNAAKHGALSSNAGRVQFAWELKAGSLMLNWSETGGPAVKAPAAQGYGTRVISASIERQLGGRALFDWRAEGLRCVMSIPRSDRVEEAKFAGQIQREKEHAAPPAKLVNGNRILLVEDEALVAMMMRDSLVELGFQVIDLFERADQALA